MKVMRVVAMAFSLPFAVTLSAGEELTNSDAPVSPTPEKCIQGFFIDHTEIIDRETIIFT